MENAKLYQFISCPLHPDFPIRTININKLSKKDLYCCKCMKESQDPKSLSADLMAFDKFIDTAAELYSKIRHNLCSCDEATVEYINILSRKAENLEKFTKHIEQEKSKVDELFKDITKMVMELLEQRKKVYLDVLDKQIINVSNIYDLFEKYVKKIYPKLEDISFLFSNKEELNERILHAKSFDQVSSCIKSVKQDITSLQNMENIDYVEYNTQRVEYLKKHLEKFELSKVKLEVNNFEISPLRMTIKQDLDQILEKMVSFQDLIDESIDFSGLYSGNIMEDKDLKLLREWIPEKYGFAPKLIYRYTRDGRKFHEKCDNKGPTVSVIKLRFPNSQSARVIGGFLDKSWCNAGQQIHSNQAFIFSLTSRVKCSILKPEYAAYGGGGYGIVFGCGTLNIKEDFSESYGSNATAYENLPEFTNRMIYFKIEEVEVYTLK